MLERAESESAWSQQSGSVSEFVKQLSPGAPSVVTVGSWILGLAVAGVLLWLAQRRYGDDHEVLSAAAAIATVVASPHLLVYDSLILVIPVAVAYRRGVLTGDRAGFLAAITVGAIAFGPVAFDAQFGVIGRGIGLEFPALLLFAYLLDKWFREAAAMATNSAGRESLPA